ncbi:MAG TPA: SET domain-containing protein-lysine N-methyltransferase [Gammaproteobacteria bacterium]|nr:SET domain-containing protein-lysine N-methyltransferase [Gammaproteobacteria bacterium]
MFIWTCDKPPLFPNASLKKIPVSELEKIIGDGFEYSERIHCDNKLKLPFIKTGCSDDLIKKIKERISNPLIDKLAICEMDKSVGRGVFAREKIYFGEIVALYAGELKLKSEITDLAYGCYLDGDYAVSAEKIGGIARFFQHLPHHPDFFAEHAVTQFKEKGIECMKFFFELEGVFENFSEEERELCSSELFRMMNNNEQNFKAMIKTEEPNSIFEFLNKDLEPHWSDIATSNLGMRTIVLEDGGVSHIIFYAKRDIEIGEQIGFTYGLGYWKNLGITPRLFSVNGQNRFDLIA